EPVIEHGPLQQFFDAETYHQDYLVKNPAGYCHISRELLEKAKSL
ncbi:MAG: peptide-methionine (S)-S-oxide reductase, partial [Oscillospiraceae bacterium]|nr:peptide-methionine (S)-S-oxide reductase [Oscillospiraceae bacterium]